MKSITIAIATAKEAIRQPAFFVLAFIAGSSLICSIFVAYFTFGEDIKMYKDTGLTTISFAGLLLAPVLFVHINLALTDDDRGSADRRLRRAALYLPPFLLAPGRAMTLR